MKTNFFYLILFMSFIFLSCSDNNSIENIFGGWEEIDTKSTDDLNHITFFGDAIGIVSGDLSTLLKMNISGSLINFENLILEPEFPVSHIRAFLLNQEDFFVLKHSLFKTTNGGNTFNLVNNTSSGNTIFGIHFFDSNTGFITRGGRLLKTDDGGESWNEIIEVNTLSKLYFMNSSTGFLYGGSTNNPTSSGPVISSGGILKTLDGGLTWSEINLSVPEINALSFANENIGYFATAVDDEIYKTTDGGINWNLVSNDIDGFIIGMVFLDENNGFVITHEGSIYQTLDGGINWTVDYQTENNKKLSSIAKTANGNVFVVGDDGLMLLRKRN